MPDPPAQNKTAPKNVVGAKQSSKRKDSFGSGSPSLRQASMKLASSIGSNHGGSVNSNSAPGTSAPRSVSSLSGRAANNNQQNTSGINAGGESYTKIQRGGFGYDELDHSVGQSVSSASNSNSNSNRSSFDHLPQGNRTGSFASRSHRPSVLSTLSRSGAGAQGYGATTYGSSGSGASESSAVSVHSVDIDNPDPDVVKTVGRHLVRDSDSLNGEDDVDGQFASLKLQGGDITRQLYNWQREHDDAAGGPSKRRRSRSVDIPRDKPVKDITAPGGFRRNYIASNVLNDHEALQRGGPRPFLTRNFIEFLSIYGHFAGEELEEDEDEDEDGGIGDLDDDGDEARDSHARPTERTSLLRRRTSHRYPVKQDEGASATKAVMLLLKSFVGTGVLFLPKAFSNGGLLFCCCLLLFVSLLSYWCFLLLIWTKDKVGVSSFGDIGGAVYGPTMRHVILASIVLSQIGFAAAYIVFVSENLQAFVLAVTGGKTLLSVQSLIWLQMLVFLPFSMIRDIAKLSGTALIADFFIFLGLIYLYFWGFEVLKHEGVADVVMFNSETWTLFIGTAIFTFEGIGLIIPIQESMKKPEQFGPVLAGVMIGISVLFVSAGALLYSAFGSNVQTVVLLNLPQDSKAVNTIQLLYSIAIMLSTPLQLFPAIRILENGLFVRSGKYNPKVKWQKNVFRFFLVIATAFVAWGGADDLDKFVSITGSFACIPLVYIYPAMLHMKTVPYGSKFYVADVILCIFGFGAMLYTTYGTMANWVSGE